MLSGIPEVDLGIEEKIRNIEATEQAKKKVDEDQNGKGQKGDVFAASNLAVNFRRTAPPMAKSDAEDAAEARKATGGQAKPAKAPVLTQRTVQVGDVPRERQIEVAKEGNDIGTSADDKATDDLHLSKFKSHFQRK